MAPSSLPRRRASRRAPCRASRPILRLTPLECRWLPATLTAGPDIDITKMADNQLESAIAANPTNPTHVVAIANNIGTAGGSTFSRSTDGGTTWTTRVITNGDGLGVNGGGDGELIYDKFGNLYVVFLDNVGANQDCKVLTSANDGQTFTVLGSPITGNLDQPKIATGPGRATGSASVWVSCQDTNGSIEAAGAQVTGLGTIGAFAAPATLAGSNGGNFGSIAVGPNGQVLDAYENPSDGTEPAAIFTNLDPDGGPQPFGASRQATTTNVGGFRAIPAQPNRTVDAEAFLAYDRSGGAHNGRVYMVYTDAPSTSSNDLNIFVRHSDDNGATWSTPVRVNDDTGANSQFFSGISVDQTTGNVAVGWFDARNSAGNNSAEYFVTASVDGGATFLPNVQVATALSDGRQNIIGGDPNEFGDFYRLDFFNNVIHAVWADNSTDITGNPGPGRSLDIATCTITLSNGGGAGGGGGGGTLSGTAFVGADAGQPPIARLIDMSTGNVTFQMVAFDPAFGGGVRVARADVNGDGIPDLIVAAGPGGGPHVKVFNGATHALMYSFFAYDADFTGGVYVAAADVNGDGKADIITGAGPGGGPHVKVFSGADGSLLRSFYAYDANFHGGVSVAAGDINGDGKADIITGAGPGGGPHVKAFSGADGSLLQSFYAYDPSFAGGVFVAAGDVDGDHKADIITGAGPGGGPHVKAFSGVTGQTLLSFFANPVTPTFSQFDSVLTIGGGVRVAAIDADGDGLADIVDLPGRGSDPVAEVHSGKTGALLGTFELLDPAWLGGVFVG